MVKNLNQLKKALVPGVRYKVLNHCRPECIGETRVITGANTAGFYSDTEVRTGKAKWLAWGSAKHWSFDCGICINYTDQHATNLVMAFQFLEVANA